MEQNKIYLVSFENDADSIYFVTTDFNKIVAYCRNHLPGNPIRSIIRETNDGQLVIYL